MLTLAITGTILAVLAGLIIKLGIEKSGLRDAGTITGTEMVLGTLICTLVLMPAVAGLGIKIARADAVAYPEYWSGMEQSANVSTTTCTKDGSCAHEYDCDSYWVTETYTTTETYTKSDGSTGTRSVTKTRQVEKWHSCPYVDREYTYTVRDTLGETYTMGDHWFPESPSGHRWTGSGYLDARWGNSLPNVPSGQPRLWVEAKARIDAGNPLGTTAVHTYKNYILASQVDIYAKSSDAIAAYQKAGLLPKPVTGIYDYYRANKVYFVGAAPGSTQDWQDTLARFDGSFGSVKQGDLHLIVVTDPKVTNPDEYAQAIEAYWQSPQLDKNVLSKNGYVVIVGSTDGTTVAWARGFSGMPIGNERLSVDVREDLPGTALTPEALLGTPAGKSIDGALGTLAFNPDTGYRRTHMSDYAYLFDQIQPTGTQKFVIVLVGFLLALVLWAVFVAVDVRLPSSWRRSWAEARRQRAIDAELTDLTHDTASATSAVLSEAGPEDAAGTSDFERNWTERATALYQRQRTTEHRS